MNNVLNPALNHYLYQMTSPEPVLLQELRRETAVLTAAAHMLSGPIEGQLLRMLIQLSRAKYCLELGTFTGYASLFMASALGIDGKLFTCENRKEHAEIAQRYFNRSPHGHKIEIALGNALETLPNLPLTFDFIFLDADKINYPHYYDILIPKLSSGGLMVVDNALWKGLVLEPTDPSARAIDHLNRKAHDDTRVETVMLSIRDGILLIRKR